MYIYIYINIYIYIIFPLFTVGLEVVVPREKTIFELGLVNVTCSVTQNYTSTIVYSWSCRDRADFSQDGPQLTLRQILRRDAGDYTCHAYLSDQPSEVAEATVSVIVQCKWYLAINYIVQE